MGSVAKSTEPFHTAVLVAVVSKDAGRVVSPQVVRNRLNAVGLDGRSARKKPYLSKKHRKQCLVYTKRLAHLEKDDWANVLFTDEAPVELHDTSGRVSVWRRTHEAFYEKCVVPTFKSSRKSLMKSVDGAYYRHLLQQEIPITHQLPGLPQRRQRSSASHRAKATAKFVKSLGLHDLRHPAQSPDLNPIGNVWAIIKRELNRRHVPVARLRHGETRRIKRDSVGLLLRRLAQGSQRHEQLRFEVDGLGLGPCEVLANDTRGRSRKSKAAEMRDLRDELPRCLG
ncbi:hypothetical protein PHYSODRAFT_320926 [Phytophthora sojae]|uniref:Transposase Tc1-like domain-containing protein n=1 Tax=Phytophthora sojae (strain P6497) TaxID=1094619 RepID=G4YI65_PHYSP|nr:hypothetical protein PHYSODRAFT_320926 [Phytophthora sojae]EGZ27076.1 hypothetical protein PHYSODRAFT_320926 [Phytophthora sojae]|eukprot:XP_009514351.1 hypothetical protein PHYSODRAFT_320926 [Phytophthora sojae]